MTKKSEAMWHSLPTRQAPIAIVLIIFNIVKSLIRTWWPLILILIFRSNVLGPSMALTLSIVVTLLVIVFSILQYFRFHFFLRGDKLHVQKGVFRKVKLDIPFDRIQSISFEQNVVHQMFDVARLKIDTAGSSKEEFEFAALALNKAEELRAFIFANKGGTEEVDGSTEAQQQLILSLTPLDLLKVGISQNHLRTAGIIFAFLLGLRDRISESLGANYVEKFDAVTENIYTNALTYGVVLFVGLLIAAFFGTLVYTLLRYYNLHVWKTRDGYKVEGGLLNRREQAALDSKIQILRWVKNPLRDLFGIVFLRMYQARSSGRGSAMISIPGCPFDKLEQLRSIYFGVSHGDPVTPHPIDWRLFYRRLLFISILPALALAGAHYFTMEPGLAVAAAVWLLLSGIYQYFYCRRWRYYISRNLVRTRSGVIERVFKALHLYKVQAVQIKQSPYQQRVGLATLVLHTASGDIRIPYIAVDRARELKRYVLYKVQSSRQPWM